MKNLIYLVIIFQLIILQNLYCNEVKTDSLTINTIDTSGDGIDLILIGGGGIAYSSGFWGKRFGISPTFQLGMELPFPNSKNNSFEFLVYSWIAKMKPQIDYDVDRFYDKIGNDSYSLIGLSTVMRTYLNSDESNFRYSIHYGLHFLAKDYIGLDLGFALNCKINEKIKLQFVNRYIIDFLLNNMFYGLFSDQITPNLLMLNISYKV